jgi:hypothetical protein
MYFPSRERFIINKARLTAMLISGLSWHTSDDALRQGFEQFGEIQEAVSLNLPSDRMR